MARLFLTMKTKGQMKGRRSNKPNARRPKPYKVGSPGHRSQNRILEPTGAYLMQNLPFFFVNKFGISDETKQRRKNVSESTPGLVFCLFSFNLFYGYEAEQFVHSVYYLQNWRRLLSFFGLEELWQGSGQTEWFVNFSPIVGTSLFFLSRLFNFEVPDDYLLLAYLNPFLWLDGLFWLLAFWALKIVFILVLAFSFLYVIAHIG